MNGADNLGGLSQPGMWRVAVVCILLCAVATGCDRAEEPTVVVYDGLSDAVKGSASPEAGTVDEPGSDGGDVAEPIAAMPPGDTGPAEIGEDQQYVLDLFGPPPVYRILFGSEYGSGAPTRHETWTYPEWGADFSFLNGAYADSTDVDAFGLEPVDLAPPPEQFNPTLNLQQVSEIVGAEPAFHLSVPVVEGAISMFHFESLLVAGFDEGEGALVYVEQFPQGGGE